MAMTAGPQSVPGTPAAGQSEPQVPMRRNVELALLGFALVLGLFAYANVSEAVLGKLPGNIGLIGLGFGAALLAGHLMIRKLAPYADPLLFPIAAMINGLGLVIIYRLDLYSKIQAVANHQKTPEESAPIQAVYTVIGIAVMIGIMVLLKDHKILQRYAYISAFLGLILIALPAVLPASISEVNGARSWIRLGGFSVQPSEFAKLLLVSFFAAYFHAKRDALTLASRKFLGLYLPRGRDMGPILVCWAAAMLIMVRETDLGVSLMFFGAFVIMLYIATERTSWLVFGLIMFVGGAAAIASIAPHVMDRVTAWLHPFSDVSGSTRQIAQSLYAYSNGRLFGTGLGQGYSGLVGFASNADFILDTVGEELGLIGLTALFLAYALFVTRGLKTALLVRDPYGKLLASGLAVVFALQVFITAGGVMRLIPMTGLPMPFLAYGGSALVANWILVALLLRISDSARRPIPPALPFTPDFAPQQAFPLTPAPARQSNQVNP
jgi:cell division protein FtsW (lipid II flippase)